LGTDVEDGVEVGAVMVSEVGVEDMEDNIEVEWLAVGVADLILLVEDEAMAVVNVAAVAFKAPSGETGAHNTIGVQTEIGSVTPKPSTAQSGLAAGVYAAGGVVIVIVVVKAVRLGPVDFAAQ
jgi:hypothetical protein